MCSLACQASPQVTDPFWTRRWWSAENLSCVDAESSRAEYGIGADGWLLRIARCGNSCTHVDLVPVPGCVLDAIVKQSELVLRTNMVAPPTPMESGAIAGLNRIHNTRGHIRRPFATYLTPKRCDAASCHIARSVDLRHSFLILGYVVGSWHLALFYGSRPQPR